jgi:molybdenum cofactor guanylyltransferase
VSALRTAAGAVLAGGASRRMGADKARLEFDGETLLARALSRLRGAAVLFVACGAESRYADIAERHGAREVADSPVWGAGAGPLAGLEAVLGALAAIAGAPSRLVVLACDLPRVTSTVVETLLARADGAHVAFATGADGDHPLLGVYDVRCLDAIRAALRGGARNVVSFLDAPAGRSLVVRRVDATALSDDPFLLTNLNDPLELAAERARPMLANP